MTIKRFEIFRAEDISESLDGGWVRFADLPQDLQDEINADLEKDFDADPEKDFDANPETT